MYNIIIIVIIIIIIIILHYSKHTKILLYYISVYNTNDKI